ncbi:MAG: hypothetical protein AYK23_05700 [Candidatus Proteinoplasmatales archaeon SG8-5]|nr:MAG: hypothetical protein AYK23_05700 [Candidatus Proteinoplasmatales archaeon SG8-5]
MPDHLREEMAQAVGKIVTDDTILDEIEGSTFVVTVGDIVTLTLLKLGRVPDLSIVDYRTQREDDAATKEKLTSFSQPEVTVENPQGVLTEELWLAIKEGFENPRNLRIVVEGEEDLASLACIALAPDNTTVIYGIPNRGPMVLHVDQALKERVGDLLAQMET